MEITKNIGEIKSKIGTINITKEVITNTKTYTVEKEISSKTEKIIKTFTLKYNIIQKYPLTNNKLYYIKSSNKYINHTKTGTNPQNYKLSNTNLDNIYKFRYYILAQIQPSYSLIGENNCINFDNYKDMNIEIVIIIN